MLAGLRLTNALRLLDAGDAVRGEAELRTAATAGDAVTQVTAWCALGDLLLHQGRHAEAATALAMCLAVSAPPELDDVVEADRARASALLESVAPAIEVETDIGVRPERVWDVIRDVGAVHTRLLPDRVTGTRIDGGQRFLTFPDGHVIREIIRAVDDSSRRLAYAVVEGARPPLDHHEAEFQVFPAAEGRSRLVWTARVLPAERAAEVRTRMEYGIADIRRTVEGGSAR
ncbi:SRPBCC family protein [Hamadaea sp. NPDC050747]|uniref:SRPBCC family protein n=1 Tax=Hamadaea sp. NPDC050747 TaxID=3155789 RepID=UPI0033DF88EF